MSFLVYLRAQWEYLLAVGLLLASSGAACWAAVCDRVSLVGPAVFLALIAFIAAMWFAEADDWRERIADANRRAEAAEPFEG